MTGLSVVLRSTSRIQLDAEFECPPGELVALVGPSGSGKTSILRAIAGLWRLPGLSGHIRVQGRDWFDSQQDIDLAPQARRAGLVFQHYALFPHMSATANVALAADKHWAPQDIAALLDRMGLTGLGERKPAQLSGGQQQRVALARALVRVMSGANVQSEAGRFQRSMHRPAWRCTENWPRCVNKLPHPCCWSPMTWPKRADWQTGW